MSELEIQTSEKDAPTCISATQSSKLVTLHSIMARQERSMQTGWRAIRLLVGGIQGSQDGIGGIQIGDLQLAPDMEGDG